MEKRKIVKLIDILCLMSLNEKIPEEIKYDNKIYHYCDITKDYYYTCYGINIYLFKTLFSKPTTFLNDEVEVLETMNEFDEIEELEIGYLENNPSNKYIINEYGTKCYLTKHSRIMADKINDLIKNQKKIIKKLKKEGNQE